MTFWPKGDDNSKSLRIRGIREIDEAYKRQADKTGMHRCSLFLAKYGHFNAPHTIKAYLRYAQMQSHYPHLRCDAWINARRAVDKCNRFLSINAKDLMKSREIRAYREEALELLKSLKRHGVDGPHVTSIRYNPRP